MKKTVEISSQQELSNYIHLNAHKLGITAYELLVLLSLALYIDKDNFWVCCPSNKMIAERSLCSERSVTSAIKSLSDKGVINNRKGVTHGNNRYNINLNVFPSHDNISAFLSFVHLLLDICHLSLFL